MKVCGLRWKRWREWKNVPIAVWKRCVEKRLVEEWKKVSIAMWKSGFAGGLSK